MAHIPFVLVAVSLLLQPQAPTVCALTGVELPSATAICPYTGEPAATVAAPPTLSVDFETTAEPLQALAGASAELRSGGAKSGSGYLHLDCTNAVPGTGGSPAGIALMAPPRPAGALAFWARSATPHVVAVMVMEEDGSPYFTAGFLPEGRWQRFVIDLRDLIPAPDAGPDENGQLDLDQVAAIVLCDPLSFDPKGKTSDLVLDLDDLSIRAEPVRKKPVSDGHGVVLGDFSISALGWIPMGAGEPDLAELTDEPGTYAARMTCTDVAGFSAWYCLRSMFGAHGPWLSYEVTLRAESPCSVALSVSENPGGDYWQAVQVTETNTWQHLMFRADAFAPGGDKPDLVNGKLDTECVHAVGLAVLPSEPGAGVWRNVVDIRRVVEIPLAPEAGGGDPFR